MRVSVLSERLVMEIVNLKQIAARTGRTYDYVCKKQKVWREYGLISIKTDKGGDNLYIWQEVIECLKRIAQGKKGQL